MIKGSMFKKCISLVMVMAILFSLAAPASAATKSGTTYGYVALGDAVTYGWGLSDEEEEYAYYNLVAEELGTEATSIAKKGYRVEEIRYLLDNDYSGDGYTKTYLGLANQRVDAQNKVANADVVSIHVGVNNFSTYLVEQMMYYLQNNGAVKYSYSFDEFAEEDVVSAMETVQDALMDKLLNAADDQADEALELINFVVEIATYSILSYVTSFNAMISSVYELNPDVELYVIGIYNAAAGEVLTYDKINKDLPIGDAFGALVEIANVYAQILAPRAYDYTYVDPGDPELLIDVMGNTKLETEDRIPVALKAELLYMCEDTAVSMVQEMFEEYGVTKTYKEALAILEEIFWAESDADRVDYIKNEIYDLVVDEVLTRFEEELEKYAGTYGDIDVSEQDIMDLLTDLDNAADVAAREGVAEEFVVDLMTTAMVGQTFAGMYIATQEDAYDAIELLEKNASGDPDALREAAANMIYEKVKGNGLENYISYNDVLALLEDLDTTTTTAEREVIINTWMNDLAAEKITQKVQSIVGEDNYSLADAQAMLAAMEGAANPAAVAKDYLLEDAFHDYMVEKFTETYTDNGLTVSTYASIDAFVTAVEQADTNDAATAIVRAEIRAAAAKKVAADETCKTWLGSSVTAADITALFAAMDGASDKNTTLQVWLTANVSGYDANATGLWGDICAYIEDAFNSAYNSYANAASAAEKAFTDYRVSLDNASEAFGQYVDLKVTAASQILTAYEDSYKGAGETALAYYADYLALKAAAVDKVMEGYDEYQKAIEKGMDSCDQLNETFDEVFDLLCDIAEVEEISLNNLLAVAKKVIGNTDYVAEMVENLMQGDELANEDKTVAYLALRYYLADGMMIMPSVSGHETIANQVIKAINGENTNSTAGNLANKVIDKGIDIYHCAKNFLSKPTTGSGQKDILINPELYVALGDNITNGTALDGADTYVDLLGDALAMNYDCGEGHGITEDDVVNNFAINGMRTEELLALLSDDYSGDAYTASRFSNIESLSDSYRDSIKNAELITIEVGINNLVTYPLKQALLAYNGEETYEMDWTQYFSENTVNKVNKGKDVMIDLCLRLVDNAESRVQRLDGKSAYDECEIALNTVSTAIEALAYGVLGYIVNLDASVEAVAELNPNATIVLVGFYNPLNDTYINVDRTVSVGDTSVDLSQYTIDVSALTDKVINQANRFLTNYVGYIADDVTAADVDSRIVTVDIKDTELCISDTDAVKDLSTLTDWTSVSVYGHEITIKIPEYFLATRQTAGEALHPNAAGHEYIYEQIIDALDYEIHADVVVDDKEKVYGDADPDWTYKLDDESSLYEELVVALDRVDGENVGEYEISASVGENGYYEVDIENGTLTIVARPLSVKVIINVDGEIESVEITDGTLAFDDTIDDLGLYIDVNGNVDWTNANYDLTIVTEAEEITGTIVQHGATLSLDGEVYINQYWKVEGFEGMTLDETNTGMLIWTSKVDNDTAVIGTQNIHREGLNAETSDGTFLRFSAQTQGFAPAQYADEIYMRAYVKVGENTYVYSDVREFSIQLYCETVIGRASAKKPLKDVCVAMLHYGAAAQEYFDYNKGDLANANILADHPAEEWNAELIDELATFTTNIATSDNVTHIGKTLDLNKATMVNYYYTFDGTPVTSELLFWDGVTGDLTVDNVSYKVDLEYNENNGRYSAQSHIFPAALYANTIYACAHFVDENGTDHYSEIVAFNPEAYAETVISRNNNAELVEAVKRMVIYGEYARIYFS